MADRGIALAAGAIALAAYVATLPPSFGMWDTAELQTVAAMLGIAHPPGCPAFTLLGYAFAHLIPFGEPAWRVNLMCSCAVAVSVSLAYAVARMLGVRRAAAAVCALGFGLSLLAWRDGTRAEILDVALVWRALAFALALRWNIGGRRGDAAGMGLAAGLACATHGSSLFLLPSLALLVFARPEGRRIGVLAAAAGGFLSGLLPYAYIPLRSAFVDAHHLDPLVALGLHGLPFWNYGDPSTPAAFWHFVTGAEYHVQGGFAGYLAVLKYPSYATTFGSEVSVAYGYAGTVLALSGITFLVLSKRAQGGALALAALAPVPYAVAYPDLQDRDRYYLFALWCAAIAMAYGFERVADLFQLQARSIGRRIAIVALAASFATVGPERLTLGTQRADRAGPQEVETVRSVTPDNAIVLADWSYATPLAYAGYVDGALGNRSVVPSSATQYLGPAAAWVRRRPLYFVGFDDDLHVPGWHVHRVYSGSYYAYELSK